MSLALRAVRGAAWTIASGMGGRVAGFVATLILARYIDPAEYGAVAVAVAIVMTADEFTHFGLLQHIVAKPKAGAGAVFHASFYHLAIGLIAVAIPLLFRDELSNLFDTPQAAPFIAGMVLATFFERVSGPPHRMLNRRLRYRDQALITMTAEIVYACAVVGFAIAGFQGFSIVYANIAQWFIVMALFIAAAGFAEWAQPCPLNMQMTKEIFGFGLPLSVGMAASFAAQHWDNLLMARLFGAATAGKYTMAYSVASIPAAQVGEHVGGALLPSFAHMDEEQRRDALVRSSALLALLICPLAVGLGAVSETFCRVVLAEKWWGIAPMLALLSALSVARPVSWLVDAYLVVRSRTRAVMGLEIGKMVLLFACIVGFSPLGELWACTAVGIAFGMHALASMIVVKKLDGIPVHALALPLIPPLLTCVPMVAAVLGARHVLTGMGWAGQARALIAEIAVGGLTFVPLAFLIAPSSSREFLRVVKKAFGRGGAAEDTPAEQDVPTDEDAPAGE